MSEEEKKGESEEILAVQDLVDFVLILSDCLKKEKDMYCMRSWLNTVIYFFSYSIFNLIEASKKKRKKVNSGNNKLVLEHVLDEWIVRNCVNHIQDEDEKEGAKQTIRTVFCTLMMMDKEKVADFLREGEKFSLLLDL